MTVREMIKALQNLGENALDKQIIMFDGPTWYSPINVVLMDSTPGNMRFYKKFHDKVLID